MSNLFYRDVKCPNCGEFERVRFEANTGLGGFSVGGGRIEKCFKCKQHFKTGIEVAVSARRLSPYELKKLES